MNKLCILALAVSAFSCSSGTSDDEAYEVTVSWTYTDSDFDDYQKEATLTFIHDDIKLSLAELK